MRRRNLLLGAALWTVITGGWGIGYAQDAVWQQTNGPQGGWVDAIVLSPTTGTLFAGCHYAGVFRSPDQGATWTQVVAQGTKALAINSAGVIFAGGNGLWKSENDGVDWEQTKSGVSVWSVAVAPSGIFAGTESGLVRSTDVGETWTAAGFAGNFVRSLAGHPLNNFVFAGVDGQGIFRSSDGGITWTAVNTGFPTWALSGINALCATPEGDLFAGTQGYGVYKSTDNGENWAAFNSGLGSYPLIFALAAPGGGIVFAGGTDGVFKYNGATWMKCSSGLTNPMTQGLAANSGLKVFAGTRGGIFESEDGGLSWHALPLVATYISGLATLPNDHIIAGVYGDGAARTSDRGATWMRSASGLTQTIVDGLYGSKAGALFAGTQSGIFISTDEGMNWAKSGGLPIPNFSDFVYAFAEIPGRLFAGGGRPRHDLNRQVAVVFTSSDGGWNWSKIDDPGLDAYFVIRAMAADGEGCLYAGGATPDWKGFIVRSVDNGQTWTPLETNFPGVILDLIVNSEGDIFAGCASNQGVFISQDGGMSWDAGNSPPRVYSLAINSVGHVYAGTFGYGIYRTEDDGLTWAKFGDGIDDRHVFALTMDSDGYLFAGTYDRGVFRTIETTIPYTEVLLDVRPGATQNNVNLKAHGILPVAILTTGSFDALMVDPLRVRFGPGSAEEVHGRGHTEDVDGDGDLDLVLHFDIQASGIKAGDVTVSLVGRTFSGREIRGSDTIVIIEDK